MARFDELGLIPRPQHMWAHSPETAALPTDHQQILTDILSVCAGLEDTTIAPWQEEEAYRLELAEGCWKLLATSATGLRHAERTLGRILRSGNQLPRDFVIVDYPAYAWRGLSIDIVRHFFGADQLRVIVDLAAGVGLNTLHLHLSDDQGWRIEVPEYPELVAESSATAVDGDPGGFITDAEFAELMDYAYSRGVAVVPEVDVPGHTNAAKHAVVGLNSSATAPEAYTGIEVGFSTLEVAAPETDAFLDAVARTLAGKSHGAVHIGGDECLVTPTEEFGAIVSGMAQRVRAEGKQVVAWQEAADYLNAGDYAQIWDERLDLSNLVRGAERGVHVIASPATRVYLDKKYSMDEEVGLQWMGTGELPDSLEWDPAVLIPGVPAEAIAGVEAAVFTETIRSFDQLTYMLLPRLAAAAEVAWAGDGVGQWESFSQRIAIMARDWDEQGLTYHRSPGVNWPS